MKPSELLDDIPFAAFSRMVPVALSAQDLQRITDEELLDLLSSGGGDAGTV